MWDKLFYPYIRADLLLIDRVFQPLVNVLGYRFGWQRASLVRVAMISAAQCWAAWTIAEVIAIDELALRVLFAMLGASAIVIWWGIYWRGMRVILSIHNAPTRYLFFGLRIGVNLGAVPNWLPALTHPYPPGLYSALTFVALTSAVYIASCQDGPRKRERRPAPLALPQEA